MNAYNYGSLSLSVLLIYYISIYIFIKFLLCTPCFYICQSFSNEKIQCLCLQTIMCRAVLSNMIATCGYVNLNVN